MDASANTFNNLVFNTTASNRYMVYNAGAMSVSNTYTNNIVANLTNTMNAGGSFYGIANLVAAASTASLTISNNTFTNNVLTGTTGVVQLLSSSGVINNSITIANNLVANHSSTLTGAGVFYNVYNASTSNASLAITNNTLVNSASSTSAGATYLFYNGAAVSGGVSLTNNRVNSFTNTAVTGQFYGAYNNGASANLDVSVNTFSNIIFNTTGSNRYMVYNTGSITVSNTYTGNVVTNLTNTLNAGGTFYGIAHVVAAASTASTLIDNNVFTNNSLTGTSGGVQVISTSGAINNTITITNNLISNYTSSISTTGNFVGITNGSNSNANLVITNNTFTNITSSISTGANFFVYNTGVVTNSISLSNNMMSNCNAPSNAGGTFYGVYNNVGPTGNLDISANTFTNNFASSTSGSVYYLYNRGSATNTFNTVSVANNLIAASTQSVATGAVYSIYNSGVTAANLSVSGNNVSNNVYATTAANRYLVYNGGPVTGTASITNNLFSNCTSTANTTGIFYGILNGAAAANLDINSNTLTAISQAATTGTMLLVYNTSAVSNTNNISLNRFTACTNSATSSSPFYGIFNTASTSAGLNISDNVFTNGASTSSTGLIALIFNSGAATNTIAAITITNNTVSGFTSSISTTGAFYSIYNSLATSGSLLIGNNSFNNHLCFTSTSPRYIIYNTGRANNALAITGNTISNGTYTTNTTGPLIGIYNTATSPVNLNIDNNVLSNNLSAASTGTLYVINNGGVSNGSVSISNNVIAGTTHTSSTSGTFYGIYNLASPASSLSVAGNTISNTSIGTNTISQYMIYNTGVATSTVSNLSISNNNVSGLISTITTTAPFYGIYNSVVSSANLNIDGNTINTHTLTSGTSARYLIYNTGSVTTNASISGNTISNGNYTLNTTGTLYGIYNTASCPQGLSINANTFSNTASASSTGLTYLIYNTGATTTTININNNLVSRHSNSVSATGGFYGIYNNGTNSQALNITGNTFTNCAASTTTTSLPTFLVYSGSSAATATISRLVLNNNTVSNFTNTSVLAPFYGVYNNGMLSGDLRMNGNAFIGNTLASNPGDMYLVYNNAAVTNTITMNTNRVLNNVFTSGAATTFYGIYNTGTSSGNLGMNTNTYTSNSWSLSSGNTYLLYNTAAATNTIFMNNNLIAGSTASTSGTGAFFSIYNSNAPANSLNMNGNTFSNNSSDINAGNLSLIYNTGNVTGSVSIQSNNLGYTFSNASTPYIGQAYGIRNEGGTTTTSLTMSGNNFSNYSFPTITGLGLIYYIYNTNNNASLAMDNNSWNNLSVNNSGGHYLMYNASGTQSLLSVTNNSIVTGYSRAGAAAGNMYCYYSGSSSPSGGSQTISGNNFSNITATVSGIGSFYGVYSNDGTPASLPAKAISNNVISNINYNSAANFIAIYADYLGDAASVGSSIYSNTVSAINWAGGIYGLYTGQNVSPNRAPNLYSNIISGLTSSGAGAGIYPGLLGGGGIGLNFYKNLISDVTQNGASGTAYGLYLSGAANTVLHNNTIGNINAPHSSALNAVNGIYIAAGSTVSAYYNTVYLNATSTGAPFNSNAIYASPVPVLTLIDNIFVNKSTPNGSGITAAFRRGGGSLSTYATASNRNVFYAGAAGTNRVIYTDGSTTYQGLPTLQAAIVPRDANSVTEDTPFLSTAGTGTNFLHIDPTLPSLTESHGTNIAGLTTDIDGNIRQGNPGYIGSGTSPDIGADEYVQNLPPCNSASAGTISPVTSTGCGDQPISFNSAGFTYTAAGGITHQWQVATVPGGPFSNVTNGGGGNTTSYTSGTLTAGNYYYVLVTTCTNNSVSNTSNQASVTINPVPTASITVPTATLCSGGTLNLVGGSNIGTIFLWSGPDNFTSSVQSPVINNANTSATGTYSLFVSNGTCTNAAISPPVLVNATPPLFTLTPSLTGICAGSSVSLSASAMISTPTLVAGTQASQNGATGYPSPYSVYYGGQKMQMLISAAELSAAGFIYGTPITSLQFPVTALGSNWGSTLMDCQNFRINMGHTSLTSLTTFQTGLTNVLITPSFTPTIGYSNIHTFSSVFVWDGVSNIVLETTFSNNTAGTPGNAVISYNSPTSNLSTIVYRADNQTAASIAAATTPNTNLGVARPDFKLNGLPVGTYSWIPTFGLTSINTQSTIATPIQATDYTVTLYNAVCSTSAIASVSLVNMPTVSVVSTATGLCVGNSATLTASGANSYTWSTGSHSTNVVITPFGGTTYTVTGENFPCPVVSQTINIPVSPAIILTAIASKTNVCQGDSITLNATGATTYSWSNGATTESTVVTPTTNTTYTVTGSTGVGCEAKRTVSIISSTVPIITVSPMTQTICSAEAVNFTASGANTYNWLPEGVNLPTYTDYPTVTTSYTLVGQAANTCTSVVVVLAVVDQCVGIQTRQLAETGIRVFPNPSTGIITASFDFDGSKEIRITDALGALIRITSTTGISETFDLSTLAKGVYFVKIKTRQASADYRIILTE